MLRSPNNPNTSILQENVEKIRHAEVLIQFSRLQVSSDLDISNSDSVSGLADTPTPLRKPILGHKLTGFDVESTCKSSKLKHPSCRVKFPQSHSPKRSILIAGRFGDLSPCKRKVKHRVEKRRKKVEDVILLGLMESIKLD
jgi:hypothetical protein